MPEMQQLILAAMDHHRAGRLHEAEKIYREVLSRAPNHPAAVGLLGVVAHQTGHPREAEKLLAHAVRLDPNAAPMWNNLGVVQMEQGHFAAAVLSFEQALAIDPTVAGLLANLGKAYVGLRQFERAREYLVRALAASPDDAEAITGLGEMLFQQGELEAAQAHLERALQLKPHLVDAATTLASLFLRRGYPTQAMPVLQRALDFNPRSGEIHHALGRALMSAGEVAGSIEHRRRAVELDPASESIHSGLLWALNYDDRIDPSAFFEEHRAWGVRHADPITAAASPPPFDRDKNRRLRVGYISGDFRDHAVAYFIEPVLAHHDSEQVEVFCYCASERSDTVTDRLRGYAPDLWRNIAPLDDASAFDLMRHDRIDILIDLAGHTRANRLLLFARRPAPVQVTWIGYSATTGMRAMDYWMTDGFLDPPEQTEPFAIEHLVRLPHAFACYRSPDVAPPIAPDPPAARTGRVKFASFNRIAKLNERVCELWSRILQRVPNSALLIVTPSMQDPAVHDQIAARFAVHGIEQDRLDIRPSQPMREHLLVHNDVDIALDPFPFTGHTSTLHTLWMGVPVVTLAGSTHVSRRGVSVMSNLGLADWIAPTPDAYVEIAIAAAADLSALATLRRSLRDRMASSPLMQATTFTRALEAAYREMWRQRCEAAP